MERWGRALGVSELSVPHFRCCLWDAGHGEVLGFLWLRVSLQHQVLSKSPFTFLSIAPQPIRAKVTAG